jgi:hypothetical protein
MSKKNKKKPQQNLSLKDRLAKHWNNNHWGAFLSLYARDKEASMRTPWAERWQEALYNCLTDALFAEKNFQIAEMALDLIRGEGEAISPRLRDCAGVAADFLYARQKGFPAAPYPLKKGADLPPLYAALRARFVSLVSAAAKEKKSSKSGAAGLVRKLAAQYNRLNGAKTASPWLTWLKIAEQLEAAAKGTDSAGTFCAVHAIARLMRELVHPSRGTASLRDAQDLPCHPLFCAVPGNQSHPAIGMLWDFFCRTGERKYGEEWGMAARVLRLSFTAKTDRLKPLKKQYDRLMEMGEDANREDMAYSLLSNASLDWTEQDHYILRMLFVFNYNPQLMKGNADVPSFTEKFKIILESFEILGRLGRRWRPQAPWISPIRQCFEEIVLDLPWELLFTLMEKDLPWESVSVPVILYIALYEQSGAQRLKKTLSSRLPLPLASEDIPKVLYILDPQLLKVTNIRTLRMFLDDAEYARLLEHWVRRVARFSGEDAANGIPPSRQIWNAMGKDLLKELAAVLPDAPEGRLCELFLEEGRLRPDSPEANAFFGALSSRIAQSGDNSEGFEWTIYFLMFLLTWPEVSSRFLLRLIDTILSRLRQTTWAHFDQWRKIADIVEKMTDRSKQKTVAAAICAQMKRFGRTVGDSGFTSVLRQMEKLEKW